VSIWKFRDFVISILISDEKKSLNQKESFCGFNSYIFSYSKHSLIASHAFFCSRERERVALAHEKPCKTTTMRKTVSIKCITFCQPEREHSSNFKIQIKNRGVD
jgi:hypothetical protein